MTQVLKLKSIFTPDIHDGHFPFFSSTEVIIEDDSPKTSIKTQAMNGGNNGSTTTSKPNEPSSTTTGDSVTINTLSLFSHWKMAKQRKGSKFNRWSFDIRLFQVDLTLSDSDDECVQVRQGNNNNTNNNSSASNKGPSATPVITNGRSRH